MFPSENEIVAKAFHNKDWDKMSVEAQSWAMQSAGRAISAYLEFTMGDDVLTWRDYTVCLRTSKVTAKDGTEVALTPTEFKVFAYLLQRRGQLCLHHDILRTAWGVGYVECIHYLRVAVATLRRKFNGDFFRIIRSEGYMLVDEIPVDKKVVA